MRETFSLERTISDYERAYRALIETGDAAASEPAYAVTKTVPLGAPNRWDYVVFDPSSHRVYVAHGDRVTVVDGHDGAILGQIEGMAGGTHGIGISVATGEGFTDDGDAAYLIALTDAR